MTYIENFTPIKTLPTNLQHNGFEYTQALRGKRSCIYFQEVTEDITYFEVFRIKVIPRKTIVINGEVKRDVQAHEKFPNDEAFGFWAWSMESYKKALTKFKELEDGGESYV